MTIQMLISFVEGTVTLKRAGNEVAKQTAQRDNMIFFFFFALFTNCITVINNTQTDSTIDLKPAMLMHY